jgi:hypothetical protein
MGHVGDSGMPRPGWRFKTRFLISGVKVCFAECAQIDGFLHIGNVGFSPRRGTRRALINVTKT